MTSVIRPGLGDIARFENGDAFDRASLAAITPRPTLGIVSGLYELTPDNAMVRQSLAGLADAIVDLVSSGGTLRANNLVEVEEVAAISSRLIVNQSAFKTRRAEMAPLIARIESAVQR